MCTACALHAHCMRTACACGMCTACACSLCAQVYTAGDARPRSLPRTVLGLRQLPLHFGEPCAPAARSKLASLAAKGARHPPPQRPARLLGAALWAREGSLHHVGRREEATVAFRPRPRSLKLHRHPGMLIIARGLRNVTPLRCGWVRSTWATATCTPRMKFGAVLRPSSGRGLPSDGQSADQRPV